LNKWVYSTDKEIFSHQPTSQLVMAEKFQASISLKVKDEKAQKVLSLIISSYYILSESSSIPFIFQNLHLSGKKITSIFNLLTLDSYLKKINFILQKLNLGPFEKLEINYQSFAHMTSHNG